MIIVPFCNVYFFLINWNHFIIYCSKLKSIYDFFILFFICFLLIAEEIDTNKTRFIRGFEIGKIDIICPFFRLSKHKDLTLSLGTINAKSSNTFIFIFLLQIKAIAMNGASKQNLWTFVILAKGYNTDAKVYIIKRGILVNLESQNTKIFLFGYYNNWLIYWLKYKQDIFKH